MSPRTKKIAMLLASVLVVSNSAFSGEVSSSDKLNNCLKISREFILKDLPGATEMRLGLATLMFKTPELYVTYSESGHRKMAAYSMGLEFCSTQRMAKLELLNQAEHFRLRQGIGTCRPSGDEPHFLFPFPKGTTAQTTGILEKNGSHFIGWSWTETSSGKQMAAFGELISISDRSCGASLVHAETVSINEGIEVKCDDWSCYLVNASRRTASDRANLNPAIAGSSATKPGQQVSNAEKKAATAVGSAKK